MKSYDLNPDEQYLLINNKDLGAGIYMYKVYSGGQMINAGKVTILKY